MKKQLILLSLLFTALLGNGQAPVTPLSPWDSLTNAAEAHFSIYSDSTEGGGYNNYKRWRTFWDTRVDEYPEGNNDFYSKYYKTMNDYLINIEQVACTPRSPEDPLAAKWALKGPINLPTQNQGLVESIWGTYTNNPDNPEILAGVLNGGLWKKEEGSNTWKCLTDNSSNFLGTMSVTQIAVDPNNHDNISIAANVRNIHTEEYGFGIYYTTDGGLSWQQDNAFVTEAYNTGAIVWAGHLPVVTQLKYHPVSGQLYAVFDRYVFKRTNGVWSDLVFPYDTLNAPISCQSLTLRDLEFHVSDPDRFFVSGTAHQWWGCINNSIKDMGYRGELWAYDANATNVWDKINMELTPSGAALIDGTGTDKYMWWYDIFMHPTNNHLYAMVGQVWDNLLSTASVKPYMTYAKLVRYDLASNTWLLCNDFSNVNNPLIPGYSYATSIKPYWHNNYHFSTDPNVIYGGDVQHYTYVSSNNGLTYQRMATGDPAVVHDDYRSSFTIEPPTPITGPNPNGIQDVVLFGNDGGVCIKKQGTDPVNSGLNMLQVVPHENFATTQWWGFDVSEEKALIAGGTMHNGMFTYDKDRTPQWLYNNSGRGDGYNAEFDKDDRRKAYATLDVPYKRLKQVTDVNSGAWFNIPDPHIVDKAAIGVRPIEVLDINNQLMIGQSRPRPAAAPYSELYNDPSLMPTIKTTPLRSFKLDEDGSHGFFAFTGKNEDRRLIQKEGTGYDDITPLCVYDPVQIANGDEWGQEITALVMDPQDPLVCWIGLGGISGYSSQAGCNPLNRVWRYDGNLPLPVSNRWTCVSDGLPVLPVNALAYQNGSDDVVYAGTDVGVFIYDKANNKWEPFNQRKEAHLVVGAGGQVLDSNTCVPNFSIGDLDINYCDGKIYAATHGRAVWESDLASGPNNGAPYTTRVITGNVNEVWSSSKYIEGNILVEGGSTLTINGTATADPTNPYSTVIHMPKGATIHVEQHASLIINNATITNSCDERWAGILLHGNGNQPQNINASSQLDQHHGILKADGYLIENATTAVRNYGGITWPNTGGIIQMINGEFRNNRRAIEFLAYNSGGSSGLGQDLSYVGQSNFTINKDIDFESHITMWGVKGITLKGNNFFNTQSDQLNHRHAIATLDASYYLSGGASNPTINQGNIVGFHEAIKSNGFNLYNQFNNPIRIADNHFDQNEIGIYMSEMFYPRIEDNRFYIGEKQTPGNNFYWSIGSKLVDVSNFLYYDNEHKRLYGGNAFDPNNPALAPYTSGTEVYNTGVYNQLISKNYYEDLYVGNDAAYTCGGIDGSGVNVGLNYSCNYNSDNTGYDFILQANAIVRNPQALDFSPSFQGKFAATRNVLTQNVSTGHINWYHRPDPNSNAPVTYWQSSGALNVNETVNNDLSTVNVQPSYAGSPDCETFNPSSSVAYNGESRNYGAQELQARKSEYNALEASYNTAKIAYLLLKDDGNTAQLEAAIESTATSEQMQLRTAMLDISPYVSLEALQTLVEENILSQAMLLEILMANPDATQNNAFIEYLTYDAPNPLPNYMIDLIKGSWDGTRPRTILEGNISAFLGQMTTLRNEIAIVYGSDSVLRNEDSAFVWMQKIPTLKTQYYVIEHWIGKNNFVQAENILNSLLTNWEMNEQELKDYQSYVLVFNFKKSLNENGMSIHQLDSTKIAELKVIADNPEFGTGREMARNALCFFYDICYPAVQLFHTPTSNRMPNLIDQKEEESGLKVYPNPAKDHVTFQIINPDKECTDCRIIITDIQGRKVYENKLNELSSMHIWDTRNIAPGNYLYQVKTNLGVESGKVVITK